MTVVHDLRIAENVCVFLVCSSCTAEAHLCLFPQPGPLVSIGMKLKEIDFLAFGNVYKYFIIIYLVCNPCCLVNDFTGVDVEKAFWAIRDFCVAVSLLSTSTN